MQPSLGSADGTVQAGELHVLVVPRVADALTLGWRRRAGLGHQAYPDGR